jgi:hypothetical protein
MRERKAAIPQEGTWQAEAGRNPATAAPGAEARTATAGQTQSESDLLMERVVERSNMRLALKRGVQNRGSAGVDGLTVTELNDWLKAHWPRVKEALLAGQYMPQPVRRVDIPKPQGGVRTLGVPTVGDRLIQQALNQVLQPIFEPTFSASSYGFRPGRNAAQAVQAAAGYIRDGRRWVVDIDLEKFLDRASQCPQVHDGRLKRSGCWTTALILRPFCRPRRMITASNSPRFTRCKTVWRDTPSRCVATCIAT